MRKRKARRISPLTSLLRGVLFLIILFCFGIFIYITQKSEGSSSIFPPLRKSVRNAGHPSPRPAVPKIPQGRTSPEVNTPETNEPLSKAVPFREGHREYKYRIAIVIDDVGYDLQLLEEFLKLDIPLTFSILPNLKESTASARLARIYGRTFILHMPMQPERDVPMDDSFITVDLSGDEIFKRIERALKSVPGAVGMSNHMGSLATQKETIMDAVMSTLARHGLFFLDSLTTPHSVARKCANKWGVPFWERDVFLDNKEDQEYIMGQIKELVSIALRKGKAIGIGHLKPSTLEALRLAIPFLEERNVKVVPLNDLL